MKASDVEKLLLGVRDGKVEVDEALSRLKRLPFEELECAMLDTHRALRQGFPEVIYGEGKSIAQLRTIIRAMRGRGENVLVTRLDGKKASALKRSWKGAVYNEAARTLFVIAHPVEETGRGTVMVVCAGTSDIPVAEEAAVTAECMGNRVTRLYDAGVAGLHRLMAGKDALFSANVIIVVAGMEGALPSVVAGMVARPVVAVPTSVGYGANLGGMTTLLAMLNSCASGVSVVNIDNGYGAGVVASLINR